MKTNSIMALFVALVIIFAVNPRMVNNLYSSVLGRLLLISIVIFLSMKSVSLGLLVVLTIIAASNQFDSFAEGFEMPETIGEDNVPITGQQKVLTKSDTTKSDTTKSDTTKKLSELKDIVSSGEVGIDKEDIKTAIMAKDSKTMQPDPNMMKNEDVSAFNPGMLTKSKSVTEGFCPYASAY